MLLLRGVLLCFFEMFIYPITNQFWQKKVPIFRDFSPNRIPSFTFFSDVRMANTQIFFWNIGKADPCFGIFLQKMGPMFRDSFWKSDPLEQHIPVCLYMWVSPGYNQVFLDFSVIWLALHSSHILRHPRPEKLSRYGEVGHYYISSYIMVLAY